MNPPLPSTQSLAPAPNSETNPWAPPPGTSESVFRGPFLERFAFREEKDLRRKFAAQSGAVWAFVTEGAASVDHHERLGPAVAYTRGLIYTSPQGAFAKALMPKNTVCARVSPPSPH